MGHVVFPIIAVFIVAAVLAFSCGIYRRCFANRRKRNAPLIIDPAKRAEFERKREEGMTRATTLRREQETDTTKGEPVWFSRWIQNGRLRHWVLYAYHTKYELRLPLDMSPMEKMAKTLLSTSQFICQPAPWNHEQEVMDMRNEYLEREGKPYAEGYYLCLVGWTKLSVEDVNRAFEEARQQSPKYSLFNNCQHFLKRFSEKILDPKHRAADYRWFKDNTETEYQKLLELPPTQEIVDYQLKMLRQAMNNAAGAQQISQQDQHRLHHAEAHESQHIVEHMMHAHYHSVDQANQNMILQQQQQQQQQIQMINMPGPTG